MPFTNGFATPFDQFEHYDKHVVTQGEFPHVTSEAEYVALADAFLGAPLGATTRECYRQYKDGSPPDVIRYNTATEEYGIVTHAGVIRSYYIADPAEHHFPTNLAYFNFDCGRRR